jgi:S-adenosylmethionine hydrolase
MKFKELNENNDLIRRKRVNEFGEWEYECRYCDNWLPKNKFRGCVEYIDAYGNCLMCSSCRAKKSQETRVENNEDLVKQVLTLMGYDTSSKTPVWKQFYEKNNIKE